MEMRQTMIVTCALQYAQGGDINVVMDDTDVLVF